MIDAINTKLILPDNELPIEVLNLEKTAFHWHGLEFLPTENYSYRATRQSLIDVGIGNLNIVFRNGSAGTFFLSNSLHKVAHNGSNDGDFTFTELVNSIEFIEEVIGVDFKGASLISDFEFGVNLPIEEPVNLITLEQNYKSRKPSKMESKGKQYGVKYPLKKYAVKIYSPTEKAALQQGKRPQRDSLIRLEVVMAISYLRDVKKINLREVKDLMTPDNLYHLGKLLTDTAKQIKIIPQMPIELDIQDKAILQYFRHSTPEELEYDRRTKKSTFYRWKDKYEKILNECRVMGNLGERVAEKWDELLAN